MCVCVVGCTSHLVELKFKTIKLDVVDVSNIRDVNFYKWLIIWWMLAENVDAVSRLHSNYMRLVICHNEKSANYEFKCSFL